MHLGKNTTNNTYLSTTYIVHCRKNKNLLKWLKLFTLIFEATCGQAVVYRSTFDLFKFSYLLLVLPCVTSCVVVCRHTIFLYNDLFFGRLWPHLKKKLSTYVHIYCTIFLFSTIFTSTVSKYGF